MRTEVGVRKDRWQRLTFGESNLSLITSVLKSPSSAVFPFIRLPKKSKTVTTDSTKPGLGFHSCGSRRNLATLDAQKVLSKLGKFPFMRLPKEPCDLGLGMVGSLSVMFPFMRLPKEPCDLIVGDRIDLAGKFPFMRLPKEPCDLTGLMSGS